MTGLGLSTVWMGETAANMMNAVMHSLKLTSGDSPAPRWLPWALFAAIAVGLLGSIWFTMTLAYTYGGINLHGWYFSGAPRWPFTYMASVYNAPEPSFAPRLAFTASGSFVMAALLFLRHRFAWWPLHPLGFSHRLHLHHCLLRLAVHLFGLATQGDHPALRRGARLPRPAAVLFRADPRRVHHGLPVALHRRGLRRRGQHDLQFLIWHRNIRLI